MDYYTRTVFEIQVDAGLGSQNAVGGGGRYDGLFESLGGKPTPGIGFAIGFERTVLALAEAGVSFPEYAPTAVYVAAVEPQLASLAYEVTQSLRDGGVAASCDLESKSLKAQFKQADRVGAVLVVVLGPDEVASGRATVRDMQTGNEVSAPIESIADEVAALLRTAAS